MTVPNQNSAVPSPQLQDTVPLEYNQCREAVKRLNDYLSNELAPAEADAVQDHLSRCKGCFAKFQFEDTLLCTIREKIEQVKAPIALRAKILGLISLPKL